MQINPSTSSSRAPSMWPWRDIFRLNPLVQSHQLWDITRTFSGRVTTSDEFNRPPINDRRWRHRPESHPHNFAAFPLNIRLFPLDGENSESVDIGNAANFNSGKFRTLIGLSWMNCTYRWGTSGRACPGGQRHRPAPGRCRCRSDRATRDAPGRTPGPTSGRAGNCDSNPTASHWQSKFIQLIMGNKRLQTWNQRIWWIGERVGVCKCAALGNLNIIYSTVRLVIKEAVKTS